MTIVINHKTYYMITEACSIAGMSRNTLLRWIREGRFSDAGIRNRNGWRLFTRDEIKRLKVEANRLKLIKQV